MEFFLKIPSGFPFAGQSITHMVSAEKQYRHASCSKSVWKTELKGTGASYIKTDWDPEEEIFQCKGGESVK